MMVSGKAFLQKNDERCPFGFEGTLCILLENRGKGGRSSRTCAILDDDY